MDDLVYVMFLFEVVVKWSDVRIEGDGLIYLNVLRGMGRVGGCLMEQRASRMRPIRLRLFVSTGISQLIPPRSWTNLETLLSSGNQVESFD